MSAQKTKIYFGYFADFEPPTLLFFGERPAFSEFATLLRDLAKESGVSMQLDELPQFIRGNVEIVLRMLATPTGMKKVDDHKFEWGLSPKECEIFSEYLDTLAGTPLDGAGGHHYLECDALDDVVVMASVGEYSVEFFRKHGDDMWKTN